MSTENLPTLAEMSGEGTYRQQQALELNEVSINGDGSVKEVEPGKFVRQGGFFRKKLYVGKKRDEKPEEEKLGERIEVVFLKIRRKLEERGRDGEILRSTNEHNSKHDAVTLFDTRTQTKTYGIAADLREKFEGLRTIQIVYALLLEDEKPPELVRIRIRGASLGSDSKPEGVMDFYQYLGSFAKDEHIWEYRTILTPLMEEGKQTYFAINFERGERLQAKGYEFAVKTLTDLHSQIVTQDTARMERMAKADIQVEEPPEDKFYEDTPAEVATPDDTGEVNPDDIPF